MIVTDQIHQDVDREHHENIRWPGPPQLAETEKTVI